MRIDFSVSEGGGKRERVVVMKKKIGEFGERGRERGRVKRYRYDFWGEGGFSISRIPFRSAFFKFFFFWAEG